MGTDGQQGAQRRSTGSPQIVITDVKMTQIQGIIKYSTVEMLESQVGDADITNVEVSQCRQLVQQRAQVHHCAIQQSVVA